MCNNGQISDEKSRLIFGLGFANHVSVRGSGKARGGESDWRVVRGETDGQTYQKIHAYQPHKIMIKWNITISPLKERDWVK